MKTDQEVNKIIAEFMGYEFIRSLDKYRDMPVMINGHKDQIIQYTKSLDALVVVWEKISLGRKHALYQCQLEITKRMSQQLFKEGIDTIQQAAAHATAKAIQEIK